MFDRIEVDVIDMVLEVTLIANAMLPETALPDAFFSLSGFAVAQVLCRRYGARKAAFDKAPACREIRVIRWQAPDDMQMIRQYAHSHGFKRIKLSRTPP